MQGKKAWLAVFLGGVFGLFAFKQLYWDDLWVRATTMNEAVFNIAISDFDLNDTEGEFYGRRVTSHDLASAFPPLQVLSHSTLPKRIEVDLTNQRVYAFEGDQKVYDFLVSTGKWGRTPTGTFRIWSKSRYQKMSGGSRALRTYYYLPNVPYIMWFSNNEIAAARGFSLHGTYWHSNFGHPMSHGCVNMKTEDAGILFYWTDPYPGDNNVVKATSEDLGTEIVIYGVTPRE